jgi:hypothetical protein
MIHKWSDIKHKNMSKWVIVKSKIRVGIFKARYYIDHNAQKLVWVMNKFAELIVNAVNKKNNKK